MPIKEITMSFSDDIKKFNEKTKKKVTKIFRGTALSLFGKIVVRTPVDTGRLRGNWQVQLNSAPTGTLDTTKVQDPSEAKRAKLGDAIFIINNLPYAEVIEDGSSKQAPQGMVKVTVAEFKSIVAQQ
jgi:hypothetical protein